MLIQGFPNRQLTKSYPEAGFEDVLALSQARRLSQPVNAFPIAPRVIAILYQVWAARLAD
jgi:hypothetical protein